MSIRSLREQMRRTVQDTFGVPALYRATPASDWVPVSVRVHERISKFGDVSGMEAAQFIDISPRLVFLVEDIDGATPLRDAIVSIAAGEAWRLGEADNPCEGLTVEVSASRVPPAQTESFPVP